METHREMIDHYPGELKSIIETYFSVKSGAVPNLFTDFFKRNQKNQIEFQGTQGENLSKLSKQTVKYVDKKFQSKKTVAYLYENDI